MRLHWLMWGFAAICFMVIGALYEGQKDMIARESKASGASMILRDMTLEQLAEQHV